jgi:hypothetical protein
MESWRRGEIDWDGNPVIRTDDSASDEKKSINESPVKKCMVVLNRMEDLPTMMTMTKLLATARRPSPSPPATPRDTNILKVHCLRLLELTQRTSAVMKVSERHFDRLDPVINVFRTFGQLNEVVVTAKMAIVPDHSFADSVHSQGLTSKADMVIVPWTSDNTGSSIPQDEFIKQVLEKVESHVSVMIDTNLNMDDESPMEPSLSRSISVSSFRHRVPRTPTSEIEASPMVQVQEGYHVFLPYWGGRDDHVALRMALQLLRCPQVKVTVVKIQYSGGAVSSSIGSPAEAHTTPSKDLIPQTETIDTSRESTGLAAFVAKTVRFPHVKETISTPVPSDNEIPTEDDAYFANLMDSVPSEIKDRLTVETVTTATPLQYAIKRAKKETTSQSTKYHLVVVGRGMAFPRPGDLHIGFRRDLRELVQEGQNVDVMGKSCLGEAGEGMLLGNVLGGLLVVQSGKDEED